ncbi:hypothetical protein DPMN_191936 [Dreissena polymorpha]|uniref:Uncharacterized protein n=1 Tax=Dreissena polymorpha TaxID=45954 RepID=A0A9D4B622_DREPO|nr:hypothetical protein DPMN_191936 [Dreissena polymorpha]
MFLPTFMTSEHPGSHVFQQTRTIFIHIQVYIRKNAPPTGGHVFQATGTIFELVQNIIGTNLLTKFHDDRKINIIWLLKKNAPSPDIIRTNLLTKFHRKIYVASRVLTGLYYSHIRKNAPPPGGHVFQPTDIIF